MFVRVDSKGSYTYPFLPVGLSWQKMGVSAQNPSILYILFIQVNDILYILFIQASDILYIQALVILSYKSS